MPMQRPRLVTLGAGLTLVFALDAGTFDARIVGRAAIGNRVGAAVGAMSAQAKPPADPPQEQPRFRVGSSYVRVDVYATRDGRPVDDLTAADLALFEDGKPQKIESFEHVRVAPPGPEATRREPTTVGESRAAARESRARVFVLFLDTYHVSLSSSNRMRMPLVQMLNGLIGQDDLVALMTPGMQARDITFTRRTSGIEQMLDRRWDWGRRGTITNLDEEEQQYEDCYPESLSVPEEDSIAGRMIARRREKLTLDALWDLVTYLDTVREERKAVLTISEGWRLYGRDPTLDPTKPRGPGNVQVDPSGRLRAGDMPMSVPVIACERDRVMLAQLDNEWIFRRLLDEANRANVSFYPIDPRGLPAFDADMGPRQPLPVARDARLLSNRLDSLRTLAGATDGVAIINSNDTASGIRRVVSDLSSYYLIGYSATNTKLDGKFRSISVRTTRPGVEIRARRGYRAPTEEELKARNAAVASASEAATPVSRALSALNTLRPQTMFRLRTAAGWRGVKPSDGALSVVGELDPRVLQQNEWLEGGRVELDLDAADGETLASAKVAIAGGERSFAVALPEDEPGLSEGTYQLRVRVEPASGTGLPFVETAQVVVRSAAEATSEGALGDPLLFRRGPATGIQYKATADPRFRRVERLRVEQSVSGALVEPAARLLDLKGQPLPMVATVSERQDGARRWLVTDAVLAPFAAGDYLLEIAARTKAGEVKTLVAFRIVP